MCEPPHLTVLIFQTLAERAPQLFRKTVVSVDLLLDNDEKMLQTITGCFSGSGSGVPELGLGNAEIVVMYSAWSLVLTLSNNSKWFKRASDWLMITLYVLAIIACIAAIATTGAIDALGSRRLSESEATPCLSNTTEALAAPAEEGGLATIDQPLPVGNGPIATISKNLIIILPIITAFFTTVAGRMQWRDKWSICYTCTFQITKEIYDFRSKSRLQP